MIDIIKVTVKRGDKTVISNFSAQLESQKATLITGPNGSGKTTLLNAISGSLPLEEGKILISGQNVVGLSAKDFSSLRAVAPQRRFFALAFSVAEIINFVPKHQRSPWADDVITQLGVKELFGHKVTELSIGQQQRVNVTLALMQYSDFYLLDEPFSAQDDKHRSSMLNTLSEIAQEKGVVVISHNSQLINSRFDQEIELKAI